MIVNFEELFNDPILDWVNEKSVKKFSNVVRDLFPKASKEKVYDILALHWERNDTPESFYEKLKEAYPNVIIKTF